MGMTLMLAWTQTTPLAKGFHGTHSSSSGSGEFSWPATLICLGTLLVIAGLFWFANRKKSDEEEPKTEEEPKNQTDD